MPILADPYAQLAGLLTTDPDNVALIGDTAEAAFATRRFDEAMALLARYAVIEPLSPPLANLSGLTAMARHDWLAAIAIFDTLAGADESPVLRFNLAWSLTMAGRGNDALPLLQPDVVDTIPQGAQLLVGLLHERGDLDMAAAQAHRLLALHPDHAGLNTAVSTLAIDIEDLPLARDTAIRGGDMPEALISLATVALSEDRIDEARRLIDTALTRAPDSPRARVGRGLIAMMTGAPALAAIDMDHGAATFGTHPGSWVAAGWAHVLAGDHATARHRFEQALAVADDFAEVHGSLAVLDLMSGDLVSARRRTDLALRLDRESLAGAMAAAMLASAADNAAIAGQIVERAMSTPVDAGGRTLAHMVARFATRR